MKNLLLALCLMLCSNVAIGQQSHTIRVSGNGNSFEQAKLNAFKIAIEQHVGFIVSSEREVHNLKLAREEILVYSSGYVDNYTIISHLQVGNTTVLVVDVAVASSKIANRILSHSSSIHQFNGDRHSAQYQTYLANRNSGDNLLQSVIADYPKHAFNIEQKPYSLHVDTFRNAVIVIPYQLSWNYNYIVSLNSVLASLNEGRLGFLAKPAGQVVVMVKDPKDFLIGTKTHFKFNDFIRVNKLVEGMTGDNEIRIKAIVKNKYNQIVAESCHTPSMVTGDTPAFFDAGQLNTLLIYGNQRENGNIRIVVTPQSNLYQSLNDILDLQLKIVNYIAC
jgi:hypothetical protein